MTRLTDLNKSSVSPIEMRLKAAMKIARLKMEAETYQQVEDSTSKSYITRTELRLTAAIKLAALKLEAEKYLELKNLAAGADQTVPEEKTSPIQSNDKNEPQPNILKEDVQSPPKAKPVKAKMSESDWVDQQARKLLGQLDMKKRFPTK